VVRARGRTLDRLSTAWEGGFLNVGARRILKKEVFSRWTRQGEDGVEDGRIPRTRRRAFNWFLDNQGTRISGHIPSIRLILDIIKRRKVWYLSATTRVE
jgi:hypothetical protein